MTKNIKVYLAGIKLERVWEVVKKDLLVLKENIEEISLKVV